MSDLEMAGDVGESTTESPSQPRPQHQNSWPNRGPARIGALNVARGRHNQGHPGRSAGATQQTRPRPAASPPDAGPPQVELLAAVREATVELWSVPTQPGPAEAAPSEVEPAAASDDPGGTEDSAAAAIAHGETQELTTLPSTAVEAPARPNRPAPDDAAAEVWALVERAQAGDAEAFAAIYQRYVDTVFRFVYFRVGSRTLAEDLTSDTFLRALKRIGSFTWQGRDLGAWLVTIARNLVADHFKSGRNRFEITSADVITTEQADREPEGSPEAAVMDRETHRALLAAVKRLNREQQECIILRFLQGFSVAETAQAMGKNEGAIKALQYRAVRALHRLLPEGFRP